MIYKAIKKSEATAFVFLWFLATYLVWIPINLATNRVTFVFYFLSTKPAICIGLAMAISDWLDYLKKRYRCLQGFASEENQYSHPDVDRT
ncbi:MAG: hypothetical protein WCA78_03260 [Rhizomicrobium sp.]